MKLRPAWLALLSTMLVGGCSRADFTPIRVEPLRERWEASAQNSAVSWWYAGEDDEHYYVVESWPLERRRYRVAKGDVELRDVERSGLSLDEDDWSNLKRSQLSFR